MREVGLVSLRGQGDTAAFLVDLEVFDWIKRTDTPGRTNNEFDWDDLAAPECVRAKFEEMAEKFGDDDGVRVSAGSYQNDRAMHAMEVALHGAYGDTVRDMKQVAARESLRIVGTYTGSIY